MSRVPWSLFGDDRGVERPWLVIGSRPDMTPPLQPLIILFGAFFVRNLPSKVENPAAKISTFYSDRIVRSEVQAVSEMPQIRHSPRDMQNVVALTIFGQNIN